MKPNYCIDTGKHTIKLIFFLCSLICFGAGETWLTCPPSLNPPSENRESSTIGPCEAGWIPDYVSLGPKSKYDVLRNPATQIQPGERLKIGWVSNNYADGFVRISIVPAHMALDSKAFDSSVIKIACFGRDQRPLSSYEGFCNHPCDANGPWRLISQGEITNTKKRSQETSLIEEPKNLEERHQYKFNPCPVGSKFILISRDEKDRNLRYETTIEIPSNLPETPDGVPRGVHGGNLFMLQLKAVTGKTVTVSYSCSLLEIINVEKKMKKLRVIGSKKVKNKASDARCKSLEGKPTLPKCSKDKYIDGRLLKLWENALIETSSYGPFCYTDSNGKSTASVDSSSSSNWPINASCDPRQGSSNLALNHEYYMKQILESGHVQMKIVPNDN